LFILCQKPQVAIEQYIILFDKRMTTIQRVLHNTDKQSPLLSKEVQENIKEEIANLLNNQDTAIGKQGARIFYEKTLNTKCIYVLSDIGKVTPEMYLEVPTYLGKDFALRVDTLTLPVVDKSGGFGKRMYTFIEYKESKPMATIALLWTLYVAGLYVTPLIIYIGGMAGLFQGADWSTLIIRNTLSAMVVYGVLKVITSVQTLRLLYEIYFLDLKPTTHMLIGHIGCLIYCIIFFMLHTKGDSSMFGALLRLMSA